MPRAPALDSTLALLREGYPFIDNRCRALQSDIFVTRLLGQLVVCVRGPDAARVFYDEDKLQRRAAVPRRVLTSLFGKDGVQTLEGERHRRRKALFMSLMRPAPLEHLVEIVDRQLRVVLPQWQQEDHVVLFDESLLLLTRAVCRWAGVPLREAEALARARDFERMVDGFGGVGPRLWQGKLARARTEAWIRGVIRDIRLGHLHAPPESAAFVMASASDEPDPLLSLDTAAVELINVLRPTVAIAWYVTFAGLALHEHPECRQRLRADAAAFEPGGYGHRFVQEVRRFYPFTPFLGARVRQPFDWRGHHFETGQLVLLDVYGSLRDPRVWSDPERFEPDRFRDRQTTAYDFIPQGGGEALGHRCAGEWLTLRTLERVVQFLTRAVRYEVPAGQDLRYDLSRMPTRPRSGLVLRAVAPQAR